MHPPLMIPWTAVAEIETMSARDFDADKAARQMGMSAQALRARGARMPNEMSAVMQF
jgi:ABC-type microcin C transport system permease subunit YejE